MKELIAGLVFGLAIGSVVYLPGPEYFVTAHAINLSVMASLWLGAALGPDNAFNDRLIEAAIAGISFVLVAMVFQVSSLSLYAGYLLQSLWCFAHHRKQFGARVLAWYPAFAMMANLGLAISFYLLSAAL